MTRSLTSSAELDKVCEEKGEYLTYEVVVVGLWDSKVLSIVYTLTSG